MRSSCQEGGGPFLANELLLSAESSDRLPKRDRQALLTTIDAFLSKAS